MVIRTTHGDRDDADLITTETRRETDDEDTTTIEYCLLGCDGPAHRTHTPDAPSYFCAQHVHRSAHVTLKRWPAAVGSVGGFT